jgi:hypothetical protein
MDDWPENDSNTCWDCGRAKNETGVPAICAAWHEFAEQVSEQAGGPYFIFVILDEFDPPLFYQFESRKAASLMLSLFEDTDVADCGFIDGVLNGEHALGEMLLQSF